MAKQKKPVHRVEMTEGKRNIIRQLGSVKIYAQNCLQAPAE